jgi:flagellar basal-body rod protein FlgB
MDPIGKNGALVQLLMDAAIARQKVIARNLANVDTPGFKAKEVQTVERDGPVKPDGNSVDLDRELSELSGNALAYQALVTLVSMKTNLVRSAIAGRSV